MLGNSPRLLGKSTIRLDLRGQYVALGPDGHPVLMRWGDEDCCVFTFQSRADLLKFYWKVGLDSFAAYEITHSKGFLNAVKKDGLRLLFSARFDDDDFICLRYEHDVDEASHQANRENAN